MKKKLVQNKNNTENVETLDSETDDDGQSEDQNGYDSMIENGTDESDDDSDEENSDDDEEPVLTNGKSNNKRTNLKTPQSATKKQKLNNSAAVTNGNNNKKRENPKNDYGKPPTLQEINQLHETQNLFHSNLFRFQIDEMLKEIKLPDKVFKSIGSWLEKFNEKLSNIKSMKKPMVFNEAVEKVNRKGIVYPLVTQSWKNYPQKEFNFQFFKPSKAYLIGSARNKTMTGPELTVDIGINIPTKTFGHKINEDFLNGNYHQKRALYLCFILREIRKNVDIIREIEFGFMPNDTLYPVLMITPIGYKLESQLKVRVIIACNDDAFKLSRFIPTANNVRIVRSHNLGLADLQPTPFYNSTVLQNIRQQLNEELIEDLIQDRQNYRDGVKMLKIWLKQRGLDSNGYGMTGFTISMFISYLIQNKKIFPTMSSYQVIRTVWNNLAASEWDKQGISMWKPLTQPTPPVLDEFHRFFDVVFLDPSGFFNITYNLNLDLYKTIRNESENAIKFLNNFKEGSNAFSWLFMTKMPFYQQFDHVISVKNVDELEDEIPLNYFEYKIPSLLKQIITPLRVGFGTRVTSITPFVTANSINFGLILNANEAFNIIIKGPPANEPESKDFRDFWGDHSKLRRFQDGTITEAVVLCAADANLPTKRLITKNIADIIFKRHLNSMQYTYIASQIECNDDDDDDDNSIESIALSTIQAFDEIGKCIRTMDDLPLTITSVQGISPIFRYTDPRPASTARFSKNLFISQSLHRGKLQLTTSGKWPNNLEAMRRIKAAFYVKIAENLRRKRAGIAKPWCDGINIMRDNFVFNISLTHPKEIALVKEEPSVDESIVKKYRDNAESIEMEKESLLMPKITSYLHGIYLSSPAFGPTSCLVKKWLSYHYIDSYLFPDECVDLLVATIFMQPEPFFQPNQPQLGFFRFLSLLATKDWTTEAALVNFNKTLSDEEIGEIEKVFRDSRSTYPPLCIITSCDGDKSSIWTKHAPTEQVLARIILLARHSLSLIDINLLKCSKIQSIFKDSTEGYDLAIHLKDEWNNRMPAGADYIDLYLAELRSGYSDVAIFFFNTFVRDKILVLFRPDYMEQKDFKTSQVNCRQWNVKSEVLESNLKRIIKDFELIGHGVVHRIENLRTNK